MKKHPVKQLPAGTWPVTVKQSKVIEKDDRAVWFVLYEDQQKATAINWLSLDLDSLRPVIEHVASALGIAVEGEDTPERLIAVPEEADAAVGKELRIEVYSIRGTYRVNPIAEEQLLK